MADLPADATFEKGMAQLRQPAEIPVRSNERLAGAVARLAAELRDERRKKGEEGEEPPDPGKMPVPRIGTTPWDILQAFGRATALSSQNPSRGLSHHWNCLRYLTTLCSENGILARSEDAKDTRYHNKGTQSRDLGIAVALLVARRTLERLHPGYRFEVVDLELALAAGWAMRARDREQDAPKPPPERPAFFLVGRKAAAPLLLAVADGRGSHAKEPLQHKQLTRSAELAYLIALGSDAHPVPNLLLSTTFAGKNGIEVLMLGNDDGGELGVPGGSLPNLSGEVEQQNFISFITTTDEDGNSTDRLGFHIEPGGYEWLSRVLVRSSAAMLLTFAGDRDTASRYLTQRQGFRIGGERAQHGLDAQCDVRITVNGIDLDSTDHVFRFRGVRVEVFSGLPLHLYELLKEDPGHPGYEAELQAIHRQWRQSAAERHWGGIITMDRDGAVMALRKIDDGDRNRAEIRYLRGDAANRRGKEQE
ncbi:hypothetical protein ATK36_4736 [Amycolatopsis sulphurea]|uniref:Uncharacterized protein n=1 Tax=Amycolatopsis sulphurea TaxID=76022 RepID=A0A2A9FDQ2_9PSEU|nr:hypothetical protein [Amycolatopsis sulphurea]PFG49577.1 hypothetical protein ATK36_4736 [Amycolatopsis sulphurea]